MKFSRRLKRVTNWVPEWVKVGLLGGTAIILFILGGIIIWAAVMPIPSINSFENRQVAESTKIYDRTGNVVLYDVHGTVRRTSVPLDAISPYIQQATIAIEDRTFYENAGFRPLSFIRAAIVNVTTGSYAQGGSTITQQVVKNALLNKSKTIPRKIEEIILALRLTRSYSKQQILNTYLNENPYGGTIYGVQEASQYFFGVDAKDVTIAQAAYLAALPQAPTYYSPYGNHRDALDRRKNIVLAEMKEQGYVTDEEYEKAVNEKVEFKKELAAGIKAPHFVFYVREYLEEKYGADQVAAGGLRVITSLDYDLQQKMDEVVAKHGPGMQTNFNASNASMVAIDPKTGQILAMVGSRDYFNDEIQGKVNVAVAERQPGSSFKPFVYATAFKKGYTPETVVYNLQTQFSTACSPQDVANSEPPCYSPQNYDGKFSGPISFRDALAQSQNIPAVKALYLAGIEESLATARDMGITTLDQAPGHYGLTLVLGGGEVTLLEETAAYSVFANDGVRNPPTGILEVTDKNGKVLEKFEAKPNRVLDPQIARQMNSILSDNKARAAEFGLDSPLNFPGKNVADKTGTTNDYRDVWVLGYTPSIAVGAWAGNNDNSPMVRRIAAFIIAPMWHEFMEYATDKYPADDFAPPAPDPNYDSLPPVLRGNWNTDATKGLHDILYWVNKDSPRSGFNMNPWADVQTIHWDYPVQLWAGGFAGSGTSTSGIGGQGNSVYIITSPGAGSIIPGSNPITVTVGMPDPKDVHGVTYLLNGTPVGSATAAPFTISFMPMVRGMATLQAIFQLRGNETTQTSIQFTIQ
ncbi:PBP1A family penicillin-binding protein [Candidatus Parcubacteria bacterium]|nr:MAG: PBP1A family penicillin-binding protein [Candidatus Parcubacteria bacterium]